MIIKSFFPIPWLGAAVLWLSACSALPRQGGQPELDRLLAASGQPALTDRSAGTAPLSQRLQAPLDVEAAVALAWQESPRVRQALAQLGLAGADLFESGRLRNPSLSLTRLGGQTDSIGLALMISDLISLPMRRRIGREHWQAALARTAQALVDEAAAVRADWFRYVAALQVAALRDTVAEAAALSAELADRFHAAGNISALQRAREQAAATVARTDAARARADRFALRMALAERLGLAGRSNAWDTPDRLPMPPTQEPELGTVLDQAHAQRLDLLALRAELAADGEALKLARRLGWLGEIELGAEREREDEDWREGPTLEVELPIFRQGQAGRARARARHEQAKARLDLALAQTEAAVRTGLARLATRREIVAAYRDALIPQREAIVAREQERYNFMLIGAFELIQARQQEFDAYQSYLEAIRDYWLARVELARVAGGELPGDSASAGIAPAVEDLLRPADESNGEDHRHGHHHHP